MRVSRIYVALPLTGFAEYELTAETAHYVSNVLRLRRGSPVVLFNGTGGEFAAQIEAVERGVVRVRTAQFQAVERESSLPVCLGQGVARGERMDYIVQKAVELGVTRVDLLLTERVVVRLDGKRAQRRVAHWRGVAIHACEQSGRTRIPCVSAIVPLHRWLQQQPPAGLRLILDPRADQGLAGVDYEGGPITLLIGPEGGLSPQERQLASDAGFIGIALGPRVLRTETATLAAVTALQLRFGDLSTHQHKTIDRV